MREDKGLQAILEVIGQKLKDLRKHQGYASHAEFAAENDLPTIQYWRMEKGRANITLKSLVKILRIHDLTLDEFFTTLHTPALNSQVRRTSKRFKRAR